MGLNDDCMNFYARLTSESEVINDSTFVLLVTHDRNQKQGPYFKIGDPITFMNANTGDFDAYSTIAAIDKVDWGGQQGL